MGLASCFPLIIPRFGGFPSRCLIPDHGTASHPARKEACPTIRPDNMLRAYLSSGGGLGRSRLGTTRWLFMRIMVIAGWDGILAKGERHYIAFAHCHTSTGTLMRS